jgi:hypothetical protein
MSDGVRLGARSWERIINVANGEDQDTLELATLFVALMMITAAASIVFGVWLAGAVALLILSAVLVSARNFSTHLGDGTQSLVRARKEHEPPVTPFSAVFQAAIPRDVSPVWPSSATFELRHIRTRRLIRAYTRESAALAFVRDVVHLGDREQASQFELLVADGASMRMQIAKGVELVKRALQDGIL